MAGWISPRIIPSSSSIFLDSHSQCIPSGGCNDNVHKCVSLQCIWLSPQLSWCFETSSIEQGSSKWTCKWFRTFHSLAKCNRRGIRFEFECPCHGDNAADTKFESIKSQTWRYVSAEFIQSMASYECLQCRHFKHHSWLHVLQSENYLFDTIIFINIFQNESCIRSQGTWEHNATIPLTHSFGHLFVSPYTSTYYYTVACDWQCLFWIKLQLQCFFIFSNWVFNCKNIYIENLHILYLWIESVEYDHGQISETTNLKSVGIPSMW